MQHFNIVWFRNDLRLADNPALHAAVSSGKPVLALFIHDEESEGIRPTGGAARWWLHGSLACLADAIRLKGGTFLLCEGKSTDIFAKILVGGLADAVFWNDRYGPAEAAIDREIAYCAARHHVAVYRFDGNLLNAPAAIRTRTGGPFKVFTPFLQAVLAGNIVSSPLPPPRRLPPVLLPDDLQCLDKDLTTLALEPVRPDWAGGMRAAWKRGEAAAWQRLETFLAEELDGYAAARDFPGKPATSRLSPHLRFGEISPLQIRYAVEALRDVGEVEGRDADKFLSELIWREFAYHVLYHFPELVHRSRDSRFDGISWSDDREAARAWQRGQTGFPLIDAGMRQLWRTGWMHNRVRMIVGSFLVKHLLMDWRVGESWFWDTLVDADQANNLFGWQWIAGCGFDAAPFHRIFNPVLQSQRFDPSGDYIRTYVPELAALPDDAIHNPWSVPPMVLQQAGIRLGTDYPDPIVDLAAARKRALSIFGKK